MPLFGCPMTRRPCWVDSLVERRPGSLRTGRGEDPWGRSTEHIAVTSPLCTEPHLVGLPGSEPGISCGLARSSLPVGSRGSYCSMAKLPYVGTPAVS